MFKMHVDKNMSHYISSSLDCRVRPFVKTTNVYHKSIWVLISVWKV